MQRTNVNKNMLNRRVLKCFLKIDKEDDFRSLYGRLFHNLGVQTEQAKVRLRQNEDKE